MADKEQPSRVEETLAKAAAEVGPSSEVPNGPLADILRRYGDNPARAAVVLHEILSPRRGRRGIVR